MKSTLCTTVVLVIKFDFEFELVSIKLFDELKKVPMSLNSTGRVFRIFFGTFFLNLHFEYQLLEVGLAGLVRIELFAAELVAIVLLVVL